MKVNDLKITQVSLPNLGQEVPSSIVGEVIVNLEDFQDYQVRQKYKESISAGDTFYLLKFGKKNGGNKGLRLVRGVTLLSSEEGEKST